MKFETEWHENSGKLWKIDIKLFEIKFV